MIWFISDTHFGHESTWSKFKLADGCTPLRPFSSTEEMDETMVARWNERVDKKDRIYHLGDVVINRKNMRILDRLNGRKKLIMGNHDIFPAEEYLAYFDDVCGSYVVKTGFEGMGNLMLTHIPLHPDSVARWAGANVHGHLHAGRVLDKWDKIDPRYFNVSVEQINFAPISMDELVQKLKEQQK